MKTVFLCTRDDGGGAAKAVYGLHRALRTKGVNTKLLVTKRQKGDHTVLLERDDILGKALSRFGPFLEAQALRFYPKRKKAPWWPSILRYCRTERNQLVRDADLIILTWVCGFLHPKTVGLILRLGKPVLWRLSDMWPFTGGCHYSGGCLRYEDSCGCCPLLKSPSERDLSRIIWSSKRRHWDTRNLTVVSPSRWLADRASRSALFRDTRVEVIPTGIDTTLFRPIDRRSARSGLSLPRDKDLVLFGATDAIGDPRKGGHFLSGIFKALRERCEINSMCLVAFGTSVPPKDLGVQSIAVGVVRDNYSLAMLYSACDLFVAPYMEDNLPNTILESLSCGTPCVAFRIGGIPEVIVHRENGYLAPPFDTKEMARGIRFVLDSDREALRTQIRSRAERYLSLERCAQTYLSLFSELLQSRESCVRA